MVPSSPFFPVEGGENHIHMDGFGLAVPQGHQPVDRGVGGEEGGGNGALLPGAGEDVLHRAGVQQPAPLFGDAHHVHLVSFVGEVLQDGSDGHPGDFMLGGDAPRKSQPGSAWRFCSLQSHPMRFKKVFPAVLPKRRWVEEGQNSNPYYTMPPWISQPLPGREGHFSPAGRPRGPYGAKKDRLFPGPML